MLMLNAHYLHKLLHPVLVKRLADTDGRSSRLAASLLDESMESSETPRNILYPSMVVFKAKMRWQHTFSYQKHKIELSSATNVQRTKSIMCS